MNKYISDALIEAIKDKKTDEACEIFRNFPLQKFDIKKVWKYVVKANPDNVDMDFLKFFIGIPDDESYEWALYYAIKVGKFFLVKKLVEEKNMYVDITFKKKNFFRKNPLILAAAYNHPLIVSYLLSGPMGSNASNTSNANAIDGFASACRMGNTEVAEIFLNDGRAWINDVDSKWGSTALMHASQHWHYETIHFLLKRGANPNLRSLAMQKTAIEFCRERKESKIIESLLREAADGMITQDFQFQGVEIKKDNEELTKKLQIEVQNKIYSEILKKLNSGEFVLK